MKRIKKRKFKNPLIRPFLLLCIAFTTITCLTLGVVTFRSYTKRHTFMFENSMENMMRFIQSETDGDNLRECVDSGKISDTYKDLVLLLSRMMQFYGADDIEIVTVKEGKDNKNHIIHIASGFTVIDEKGELIDSETIPMLNDDITNSFPEGTADRLIKSMEEEKLPVIRKEDIEGTEIMIGEVSIYDQKGNPVAVLICDINIEEISMWAWYMSIQAVIGVMAFCVLFSFILMAWLNKRVTKPAVLITEAADRLSEKIKNNESIDTLLMQKPDIKPDNEISALADSVVLMADNILLYAKEKDNDITDGSNRYMSDRDALTGVRGKNAFEREKHRISSDIKKGFENFGIAVVCMNDLYELNKQHGKEKADSAIAKLCNIVCEVFGHSPVFRTNTDEFTIILTGSDLENIEGLISVFYGRLHVLAEKEWMRPWEKPDATINYTLFNRGKDDSFENVYIRAAQKI